MILTGKNASNDCSKPKDKAAVAQNCQSLKSPKIASVDVVSRDDKASVQKEFDAMLRQGSFSVLFIKDH